jgi:hypothetical protein
MAGIFCCFSAKNFPEKQELNAMNAIKTINNDFISQWERTKKKRVNENATIISIIHETTMASENPALRVSTEFPRLSFTDKRKVSGRG